MSERQYTLEEIGRMRDFLLERSRPDLSKYGFGPDGIEPKGASVINAWRRNAEEELRTCLLAGVDPAEFSINQQRASDE